MLRKPEDRKGWKPEEKKTILKLQPKEEPKEEPVDEITDEVPTEVVPEKKPRGRKKKEVE